MKVITMTAYKRPDFLEQALAFLSRCEGVKEYVLIVSVDPAPEPAAQEKIRELLGKVSFCVCRPMFNPARLGLNKNTFQVLDAGFARSEFVTHVEDDVLLSPDALMFFEHCRNKYRADRNVFNVSAVHNRVCSEDRDFLAVERRKWFTVGWGWGTWRDRWEGRDGFKARWGGDYSSWAPYLNLKVRGEKQEVHPRLSRGMNIGTTGENTPSVEFFNKYCLISSWGGDARWAGAAKTRAKEWSTLA